MIALMNVTSLVPLWLALLIVAVLSTVLSWLLVALVRRWWPHPTFKENNEFVGFTYAVYGLIYGVVLAFTIVTAWTRFSDAESDVMREATVMSELWRDSSAFPENRSDIHEDLAAYAASVVEKEWREMAVRGMPDTATQKVYEHLWTHSYQIEPTTKNQEAFLAEYLGRLNELSAARRLRLLHCRAEVSGILWMVLLAGGLPAIAYALLFATKHGWVHVMVTAFMMGLILLCLLVTFSLQYPFSGRVAVGPEPIKVISVAFQERLANERAKPQ